MSDDEPTLHPIAEEVRRKRMERGWSQGELARRAMTSTKSITRLETAVTEAELPKLLPRVQRVLGIGDYRPDEVADALRLATASQLTAELATRLAELEQLQLDDRSSLGRIRTGDLPEGLSSRPDVGRGPRVGEDGAQAES